MYIYVSIYIYIIYYNILYIYIAKECLQISEYKFIGV